MSSQHEGSPVFETLNVRTEGSVLFSEIAAPPMNLLPQFEHYEPSVVPSALYMVFPEYTGWPFWVTTRSSLMCEPL